MEKKLYRSQRSKVFGGVAGGLAEYFDIDPVIVRIVFVIATLGWGVSFLIYIIMWIIIPVKVEIEEMNSPQTSSFENYYSNLQAEKTRKKNNLRVIVAVILIFLGSLWFLENMFPFIRFHFFFPLLLIALGVLIILKASIFKNNIREVK
ncbi:MAG: PspC domain-containing protein [FCB group bacterium]|jgi:phage shock protein PspC (stress-responsive transcriptional regulator)